MRFSKALAIRTSIPKWQHSRYSAEKNVLGMDTGARPPNQKLTGGTLFQDPLIGYWESHGKMIFKADEDYGISEDEKQAVLDRHRTKEILKKEYLRREFDPFHFRYKEGVMVDPAMFRWYSARMTEIEQFRYVPKTMAILAAGSIFLFYIWVRLMFTELDMNARDCVSGKTLWWDRDEHRMYTISGHDLRAPTQVTVMPGV